MLAECEIIHAVALQRLQACNLGNEIHHSVFTAHQLTETHVWVHLREMLLTVGVRKGRRQALHGRAENVNPGRQCHVERGLHHLASWVRDDAGEIELLHQANGSLEMLVPGNVEKTIVETTDNTLEEDEAEGCFQNLLVILILLQ